MPRCGPLTVCAMVWIAGAVLAHHRPDLILWLGAATLLALATIVLMLLRRGQAARMWAMVALFAVSGAWMVVHEHRLPPDSIAQYIGDESILVRVTGVVEDQPTFAPADRGAFAAFSYRVPVSLFYLTLESIQAGETAIPVSGKVVVKVDEVDHRLRGGERVMATGWLSGINGPSNPGEFDFRPIYRQRDVHGRLTLRHRDNIQLLESTRADDWWQTCRTRLSDSASAALLRGVDRDLSTCAFLDALLLGRTSDQLDETYLLFRNVGLAHLLSLSGAHLGILLGMVWLGARLVVSNPPRAAMLVLVVLGLYMLAVPIRTPIVRAAIMAAIFASIYATGRQARSIDVLALAAVVVLIWKPGELFTAGFQLSFIAVAGLVLFTRPLAQRLTPMPLVQSDDTAVRWRYRLRRRLAEYVAANIVAFCIVSPLVAYHFQIFTPWAIVLGLLTLPLVTLLLAVGYLKIVLGMVLPSTGWLLAPCLAWLSDGMMGIVASATWQTSAIELARPPSIAWTVGAMLVTIALFTGCFAKRRTAFVLAGVVCAAWFVGDVHPVIAHRLNPFTASRPIVTLHMIAVGDGSCYVARIRGEAGGREHVVMFDCGSQMYFDVGINRVLPALKHLGIDHIDTLVLSHADFDHFSGTLDVADGVTIGRVLMPPQMIEEARQAPRSATAFLIEALEARQIPIQQVTQGWHETLGTVTLDMLWPPADYKGANSNESSAVLAIAGAGRRILLCGDIQENAMTELLASGIDLSADVCDIPHHGSFVPSAPRFLTTVGPRVVLQSSGPGRLYRDKWAPFFERVPVARLITARRGMVTVNVQRNGTLDWHTFRDAARGGD